MSTATNVAFLTGITIVGMGVTEASAATVTQGAMFDFVSSSNSANLNQFNPILGSLNSITIAMNSTISPDLASEGFTNASVTVDGLVLAGVNTFLNVNSPFNFSTTLTLPNSHSAAFTGLATIPVLFSFNPGGCFIGCEWKGTIQITYDYTVAKGEDVPLPAALPLFAAAVTGLGAASRRRKGKAARR